MSKPKLEWAKKGEAEDFDAAAIFPSPLRPDAKAGSDEPPCRPKRKRTRCSFKLTPEGAGRLREARAKAHARHSAHPCEARQLAVTRKWDCLRAACEDDRPWPTRRAPIAHVLP